MSELAVATVVALGLNAVVIAQIRRHAHPPDREFLRSVYLRTLFLRYGIALFLFFNLDASGFAGTSPFAAAFWGDSSTYDIGADQLARSWSSTYGTDPFLHRRHESGIGFVYAVGALYYLFGRNQILVQFINGTIGALSVLAIYAIARHLFDSAVARRAAQFMAYFPQMIFWSAAMYKDPSILLCIATSIYAVLQLQGRFTLKHVLLFLGACLALFSLRFYVFYMVAFATLGTFVFSGRRGVLGGIVAQTLLLGVFFTAFSFAAQQETVDRQTEYFNLQRIQSSRSDMANLGRSGIGGTVDVSTPAGALAFFPIGLVYLLFSPFPWSVSGLRQVLTVPETLYWYSLMPAFARGLVYTLRNRFRASLPILAFAGMLTVAYALFQGNVGTAYRQRTQINMFFFVFMALGLVQKERRFEPARSGPLRPAHR